MSKNPAGFWLTFLECMWLYEMAQSIIGIKKNPLHTSSGRIGVDGFVMVLDVVVLVYFNYTIDK
jgi:hypothetical protein